MNRRPIAVTRTSTAFALRYNLFRRKWQPDLCCAVPEDQPVPSFITGESWDFGGTWWGVRPLGTPAAELGAATASILFQPLAGLNA